MLGRENLIWEYAEDLEPDEKVYRIEEVNDVMDKMEGLVVALENRIRELETEAKKQKAWENYSGSDNGWV